MPTEYEHVARGLSVTQWQYLIDHCDGQLRVCVHDAANNEGRTRRALVLMRLLQTLPPDSNRPQWTALTERGHGVMCSALGMMADMLTKAGFQKERIAYGKIFNPAVEPLADGASQRFAYIQAPPTGDTDGVEPSDHQATEKENDRRHAADSGNCDHPKAHAGSGCT